MVYFYGLSYVYVDPRSNVSNKLHGNNDLGYKELQIYHWYNAHAVCSPQQVGQNILHSFKYFATTHDEN